MKSLASIDFGEENLPLKHETSFVVFKYINNNKERNSDSVNEDENNSEMIDIKNSHVLHAARALHACALYELMKTAT